jgi:hypothetical protein
LVFEPEYIEIGIVDAGVHSLEFHVRNVSHFKVTVEEILLKCGCTTTNISNAPITVGESRIAKVDWDTSGLNGESVTTIALVFSYMDGDKRISGQTSLTLSCTVIPPISFHPEALTFDNYESGIATIQFSSSKYPSFTLKSVRATSESIVAKVAHPSNIVSVDFSPSVLNESHSIGVHAIVVETDVPGYSQLRVPVVVK